MVGTVREMLGLWFLAGSIITITRTTITFLSCFFSIEYAVEAIGELVIMAMLEHLPFPFNLIVAWQLSPADLIMDFLFQSLIFIFILLLLKSDYE